MPTPASFKVGLQCSTRSAIQALEHYLAIKLALGALPFFERLIFSCRRFKDGVTSIPTIHLRPEESRRKSDSISLECSPRIPQSLPAAPTSRKFCKESRRACLHPPPKNLSSIILVERHQPPQLMSHHEQESLLFL